MRSRQFSNREWSTKKAGVTMDPGARIVTFRARRLESPRN